MRMPSSKAASVPAAMALTAMEFVTGQISQPVNGSIPACAERMMPANVS